MLAIPPTIIILLNFLIKLLIILIFVEIFEPPIISVTGFFISEVILFRALISSIICKPKYEGMYFVIPSTEAWDLWEQEKASLTYISPKFDIFS